MTDYTEGKLEVRAAKTLTDGERDYAIIAGDQLIAEAFGRCAEGAPGVLPAKANAHRLALAWNCHSALVAALEEAIVVLGRAEMALRTDDSGAGKDARRKASSRVDSALLRLRKALALTKEEQS